MSQQETIEGWIAEAKAGSISWTELAEQLLTLEHSAANLHQPDLDRARRCGFGEVVFGESKSGEVITQIARRLLQRQAQVLVTRCASDKALSVSLQFPFSRFDELGRTLRLSQVPIETCPSMQVDCSSGRNRNPVVAVVTAGSTDLPVAREALETLGWMNIEAYLLSDVGVAGPYRLLPHLRELRKACAIVVCAGMEGALASVLGGLVSSPVIAVPTSVGYGANLAGITTLLSMISSCAASVTVVNIDAGFKGGYVAGLIARQCAIGQRD
jgi:pyridinium-3,5-biscarboxylic acid mononucleotide synthase